MIENKHTMDDLRMRQALPLSMKIAMSKTRIREWVNYYGEDGVYISFSGGKDSTVLVDLVDETFPGNNIPLVFVDTGLEYPEIREFVKGYGDRVVWLKPEMNFKEVISKYGYPFFSKELSRWIGGSQKWMMKNHPEIKFSELTGDEEFVKNSICDVKILLGRLEHKEKGDLKNEYSKTYNKKKYQFAVDMPWKISPKCCSVMKKAPMKKYCGETGRNAMTGQTADESKLREKNWLKYGCNGFQMKVPISNPMSIWTEQDVLLYIKQKNLPICSAYGEIVEAVDENQVEGQLTFLDFDKYDIDVPKLKTTGCDRTGCVYCAFGCHLEKEGEGRFERLKYTHPKIHEYIMKPWDEGGLGYKEIIEWINEKGNFNIRY